MPFDGIAPRFRTLPDNYLDRALLRRHEENYVTGASALVQQEIAHIRGAIYHKPGGQVDWAAQHLGRVGNARKDSRVQAGDFQDDDPADHPIEIYDPPELWNPTGMVRHGDYEWDLLSEYLASTWDQDPDPNKKRV